MESRFILGWPFLRGKVGKGESKNSSLPEKSHRAREEPGGVRAANLSGEGSPAGDLVQLKINRPSALGSQSGSRRLTP